MNKLLILLMAGALAGGFSTTAAAQDNAATEVTIAHAHAVLAQNADSVAKTHLHLHHVVNCLVGPNDEGFDADAGNPCQGQGNGALPDSANNQTLHSKLKQALATAQAGLSADTVDAAHAKAAKVATTLQSTPAQKPSDGYSQ